MKAKNEAETEKLEKQARDDEKEIEELKDDLEKLDYKVWQEQENVKDLVIQREGMDESNEREFKKIEVELESKNSVIKSLNKKIEDIEQENDNDLKSNDKEDTCKKCNFKAKTGNNLKMHMRKEHKLAEMFVTIVLQQKYN